jgi:hypothetical protein
MRARCGSAALGSAGVPEGLVSPVAPLLDAALPPPRCSTCRRRKRGPKDAPARSLPPHRCGRWPGCKLPLAARIPTPRHRVAGACVFWRGVRPRRVRLAPSTSTGRPRPRSRVGPTRPRRWAESTRPRPAPDALGGFARADRRRRPRQGRTRRARFRGPGPSGAQPRGRCRVPR